MPSGRRGAKAWKGRDFSFCDDVTSGLAGGYCAAHDADMKGGKRDGEMAALSRGWTPAQHQAWEALKKAHDLYVDAHSSNEIDLSGTLRGALATAEDEALKDELLAMLKALQAGKAPQATAAQFEAADSALNAAYRRKMAALAPPRRDALRASERAWLKQSERHCRKLYDEMEGGTGAGPTLLACTANAAIARTRWIARFR